MREGFLGFEESPEEQLLLRTTEWLQMDAGRRFYPNRTILGKQDRNSGIRDDKKEKATDQDDNRRHDSQGQQVSGAESSHLGRL